MSCAKFLKMYLIYYACVVPLHAYTQHHPWGSQRWILGILLCFSLPYSFEIGSLIESGARLAVDKSQLPRLQPLSTGVTGTHSHTRLRLGARDLNSGPTLAQQTEQCPQPCAKICSEFPQRSLLKHAQALSDKRLLDIRCYSFKLNTITPSAKRKAQQGRRFPRPASSQAVLTSTHSF